MCQPGFRCLYCENPIPINYYRELNWHVNQAETDESSSDKTESDEQIIHNQHVVSSLDLVEKHWWWISHFV